MFFPAQRPSGFVLALAGLLLAMPVRAQVGCGVARDLVVRALEGLRNAPSTSQIEDGVQLLKHAAQQCPTLGDAWYYRSLFEKKLGHQPAAEFALRQAKLMGSEAMDAGVDPFTLAAPPDGSRIASGNEPVREKWALVVGIGRFQSGVDMLPHARQDAQDFAGVLVDPVFGHFKADNVKVLADKNATTAGVKAGLNWLARSAAPNDLVVVFVASHGTGRAQDSVGGLNYVLTHDTDPTDEDHLYGSALPMIDISEIIRSRVKAKRTAVFLDTCHSGGGLARQGFRESAPSPIMLDSLRAGVGRVIITSSQEDQSAWESQQFDNGIFTHFLIEALKQQQGRTPLSGVYEYVRKRVAQQAMSEHHAAQTPVFSKSDQGADIVLGVDVNPQAAALPDLFREEIPALALARAR